MLFDLCSFTCIYLAAYFANAGQIVHGYLRWNTPPERNPIKIDRSDIGKVGNVVLTVLIEFSEVKMHAVFTRKKKNNNNNNNNKQLPRQYDPKFR